VIGACVRTPRCVVSRDQTLDIVPEDFIAPMRRRSASEKGLNTSLGRVERVSQTRHSDSNGVARGQVGWASFKKSRERPTSHEPTAEERFQPLSNAALGELRKHERDRLLLARDAATDSQPSVQRLVHETRDFGLVRHRETRLEIGLQWKLANEREAEGVYRTDGDLACPLSQVSPACGVIRREPSGLTNARQDSLAHFGRRLPCERHRQDVRGIDALSEQIHVPVDKHARLAGSSRCLEHDIAARIDGDRPRTLVRICWLH
jgi:hypothetical protein